VGESGHEGLDLRRGANLRELLASGYNRSKVIDCAKSGVTHPGVWGVGLIVCGTRREVETDKLEHRVCIGQIEKYSFY
jgi:hypothetical protein